VIRGNDLFFENLVLLGMKGHAGSGML